MEKLIKGVDKNDWKEFMTEASKHGLKAGEFIGYLVEEHKKAERNGKSWEHALSKRKRILTDKDIEKMKEAMKVFEEEYEPEW